MTAEWMKKNVTSRLEWGWVRSGCGSTPRADRERKEEEKQQSGWVSLDIYIYIDMFSPRRIIDWCTDSEAKWLQHHGCMSPGCGWSDQLGRPQNLQAGSWLHPISAVVGLKICKPKQLHRTSSVQWVAYTVLWGTQRWIYITGKL